ncbi:hypothetical protein IAD21_05314 [Abditibacteriota bacterium]|nr:hypothetical protein IAD21_05314 [Abditibacteriota bacterium]
MIVFKSRTLHSPNPPRSWGATDAPVRAFSLLEVSIALAIFVFGALAVVRIFPGALKIITAGGDRQNAIGLNRAALVRVGNEPPLAVYDTKDGSQWDWQDGVSVNGVFEPRAVLGSARRGYSLPRTNEADFDRSALGSLRAIVGERATVAQQENGDLFVLTQFPIFGDSLDPTQVRVWKREALEGVVIDNAGLLNFDNARYASSGEPFVPPTGAIYYVTFRYHDNNALWGVKDIPVLATTNTVVVPDAAPAETGPSASTRVIAGNVTTTCAWPVEAPIAANDEGNNKRGLVGLSGTAIAAGDAVYVDYQADWGWILQAGVPDAVPEQTPTGATRPRQISLGAPYIEDRATNSIYTLCQTRKNGKPNLIEASWGENQNLSGSQKLYTPTTSDLRAGRVTFETGNLAAGETFAGARVAFRTRDGWAQQLSVAASAYKPFGCGPSTPSYLEAGEPWRDYVPDATNATLYFHASEAGKSVLVTYSYTDGTMQTTLRDRLLTIEDDASQPTGLPTGFAPSGYAAQLVLTDANGDALAPSALVSISSVRGASVSVRTAWLDGSRYTQSFLTSMRAGAGSEGVE